MDTLPPCHNNILHADAAILDDIISCMRTTEQAGYSIFQGSTATARFDGKMRNTTISRLFKVCWDSGMCSTTSNAAVMIFDIYLARTRVIGRDTVRVLRAFAVAAMSLAADIYESSSPAFGELCARMDVNASSHEIGEVMRAMSLSIEPCVYSVTPVEFALLYARLGYRTEMFQVVRCLSDTAMRSLASRRFMPSQLVAGAIFFAHTMFHIPDVWPSALAMVFGQDMSQAQATAGHIASILAALMTTEFAAEFSRYANAQYRLVPNCTAALLSIRPQTTQSGHLIPNSHTEISVSVL